MQALEHRNKQVNRTPQPEDTNGESEGWATSFPQEDFEQAVRTVQEYIRQGDVFQVNLSLRQENGFIRALSIFMNGCAL